MSHIMFFLLLHHPPLYSFRLFTNLILTHNFLYYSFTFNLTYIENVYGFTEIILSKYYPKVHFFFKEIGFYIWINIWVENIYSLFLANFSLQVSAKIWDSIFSYGISFIFHFFLAIFDTLSEKLHEIKTGRLSEDLRRIYLEHGQSILSKSYDTGKFEYEFYFIDKTLINSKF